MCLCIIWMPSKVQKHSRAQRTHEASWRLLRDGCGRKEAGRNGKYQSFENSRTQLFCPTKSNTNYISNSSQCKNLYKSFHKRYLREASCIIVRFARLDQEGCRRKEASWNSKYQSFKNSRFKLYCPTKFNTYYISVFWQN